MGQGLSEAYPAARAVFDAADRALEFPLGALCFSGSEEELALTENTQPAILAVCLAALAVLRERGLVCAAAAGHSLGEYGALVAAGSLEPRDALRAVRLRGKFMQEAVPLGEGAMAAVLGLDAETVARLCREVAQGEVVAPANLNGPSQVVVAGHAAAVRRLGAAALDAGARRVVPLQVSAPFHCELMQPAARRLAPVLDALPLADPRHPIYTNVDAQPVSRAAAVRSALLRQVASPVRWHELIEAMLAEGIETFVEVGPGKVLAGLVRGIRRTARVLPAGEPEPLEAAVHELSVAT
jgi:[acyl-carrier-protein] S-malonyltransferase